MVASKPVVDALRASTPFRHVRAEDLDALDGLASLRDVAAGELIARKGAAARAAWVVVEGRVRVGTKREPLGTHAAGEAVGVELALAGDPHPASLRASEPTTLLELSAEGVAQLVAAGASDEAVATTTNARWVAQLGTAALLAWRSLLHRRSRVIITLATVTVIFTMVLLITGMAEHFRTEPVAAVETLGADAFVVPPDATGVMTSAASLPIDVAAAIPVDDDRTLEPIIVARHAIVNDDGVHDIMLVGHEPGGVSAPTIRLGTAAGPGEVVASGSLGADVGDVLAIGDQRLRVAGVSDNITLFAGIPFVWMPLDQAQHLVHAGQPSASAFVVRGTPPPDGEDWSVLSVEEVIVDTSRPLERATASIDTMSILLWVVAGLVIGAVAYVTALERTRDFAVVKAIGGSDATLLLSLVFQSLFTALAAAAIASVLEGFFEPVFPMEVTVPGVAFVWLPIIAAAVAVLASTAGIRRIRAVDPSAAFGAA